MEEERGLAVLDDVESAVLKGAATGRGELERLPARDDDALAAPELRVDNHRQIGGAEDIE
jgi:hypothetical protein